MDTLKAGGEGAPLCWMALQHEVQPRPCVLLSRKPEAEMGQTTNWETRAVLIAMVKQESRQLVLKSIFRPSNLSATVVLLKGQRMNSLAQRPSQLPDLAGSWQFSDELIYRTRWN